MTDPIYNAINALDDIANGKKVDTSKKMDANTSKDIGNILRIFDVLTEGRATAEARQLPQNFKPENISPVLGEPERDHPTKGYFVGGESEYDDMDSDSSEAVKNAIIRRITMQHLDLLTQYGPDAVMGEVDDLASEMNDLDEIGSSDVSAFVKNIKDRLESSNNIQTQEDIVSDQPMQLGDYLDNLPSTTKVDRELRSADLPKSNANDLGPCIKTLKTDDGREIKIHGNEDDGFRVSVKGKIAKNKFSELDEATKACESYIKKGK